jgi:hypothetical protein
MRRCWRQHSVITPRQTVDGAGSMLTREMCTISRNALEEAILRVVSVNMGLARVPLHGPYLDPSSVVYQRLHS